MLRETNKPVEPVFAPVDAKPLATSLTLIAPVLCLCVAWCQVSDDFPVPMLLMEVMPNLLAKRVFHSVMTKKLIEPGYREAPDPREPMTIMFVKVIMMPSSSALEF